jgi:ABC-type amino acid transport system permease subunit
VQATQQLLSFEEVSASSKRAVYWAFLWRGFVVTLCSGVAGFVVAFVLGMFATTLGAAFGLELIRTASFLKVLGGASGLTMGLISYWFFVRWVFASEIAGFSLRLVREVVDAV